MDDKDKETIGGGTVGASIGWAVGGPYGAAIGGIAGALLGSHERKHNKALRDTFYELKAATDGRPTFHIDHIEPDGAKSGGTRGVVSNVSGAPDLVMKAPGLPYPNLIIEVETVEGIQNDERHAIDQLNDFQTQGYKRVLVVPDSEANDVIEWCETHERKGDLEQEVIIFHPEWYWSGSITMTQWAHHYLEIPEAIRNNDNLRSRIADLIPGRPIHGKRTEGEDRERAARDIMIDFFDCQIEYLAAYQRVLQELPEHESPYAGNSQVFSRDWHEAVVRMQAVRFYNHGAFLHMKDLGYSECYIPHSPHEYADSDCTIQLAGDAWEIDPLLDRLVERYDDENYNMLVTIPSRPNCTHTPVPPDEVED